jgi:hypothetical protein
MPFAAGCGGGQPTREDILPEVELTYPGATEIRRSWTPEDHDVGIHLDDLSSRAEVGRHFRLREPVPRAELFAWYRERMVAAGWSADDRRSGVNRSSFVRPVGDRAHLYLVEAGRPLVARFTVRYRIGFADR